MKTTHNQGDLDIIERLTNLVAQMSDDQKQGLRTDAEPVLNYVRTYVWEAREVGSHPVHCDGLADLPFPVMMRTVVEEHEGIHLTVGGEEYSFCSFWCMVGHFVRQHGMTLFPAEDRVSKN